MIRTLAFRVQLVNSLTNRRQQRARRCISSYNDIHERPNASGQYRRRQITPVDMVLQPGFIYIDDDELTLEPGDRVQAKADTANAIQYVISGLEQDMV